MNPSVPLRTCVCALALLLAACPAAAESTLADRKAVEQLVGTSLRAFVERAGRPLQVGAKVGPGPFVRVLDDGRLGGISVDYMRLLAQKYRFEVEFFPVMGSFDEIIRDVGKGSVNIKGTARPIDVGVHQFTATGVRSLTARQTASPIDSEFVFLGRRENILDTINGVFKLFTPGLWGLLFGVLLFLAFSLAVITKFRSEGDPGPQWTSIRGPAIPAWVAIGPGANQEREESFPRMYWNHLYNLGSLLFGQLPFPPSNDTPSRMIYILFKAFAFGLGAFYTALLVNQFQRKEKEALVSMEQFCNEPQLAGKALKDLHVAKGSSYQAYVVNYLRDNAADCPKVTDEDRKRFSDEPGGGSNLCDSPAECRQRVLDGRAYATLEDETNADWILNHGYCSDLQKVGKTGSPTASTWVLPLDPDYNDLAQSLSNAIFLARDDRSFERITKASINKGGCKTEELERVGISNVQGFLIPMAGMFLFALAIQVAKWRNCFGLGGRHGNNISWYEGASAGGSDVGGGSTVSSTGAGEQVPPGVPRAADIRVIGSLDDTALVIPLTLPLQGMILGHARPGS